MSDIKYKIKLLGWFVADHPVTTLLLVVALVALVYLIWQQLPLEN